MEQATVTRKPKTRKARAENNVSFESFTPQEQALITLGADKKKQSIADFMAEGIRFFILETVEVRFKNGSSTES
jgi:hypothetical protein